MWSGYIPQREALSSHRACAPLESLAGRRPWRAHVRGRAPGGFTLIEVMITCVIVAVLAAIALPLYTQHIVRANRTQAKQFMSDIANRQEQYLLDQRTYTDTIGSGGLGMTPPQETSGLYTFATAAGGNDCMGTALPTPGYTVTATATGLQTSDGSLCLDSVNHRTPTDKWGK